MKESSIIIIFLRVYSRLFHLDRGFCG